MRNELPIDLFIPKIIETFQKSLNVILMAPPGSGKTLRVPSALAADLIAKKSSKKIVVLVPKRIAAVSAASRIAEENNWQLGVEVGYQVRFDQKHSDQTKLLFMTEGVFVKRLSSENFLDKIDTIVFDEFHERSSLNDIAFGYCFEQQMLANTGLKILVMSATLDAKKLEAFLENSVTIQVDLRPFHLEIVKNKRAQRLLFDYAAIDQTVEVIKEAFNKQKQDILVFLPGMYEIRQVQNKLNGLPGNILTEILHGSISLDDQKRILAPARQRRIILSTNVAESSLTLPTVDAVVDSGLEKKAVFEKKIGFQRLEMRRISLFSAKQRAGRAARVAPGVCYQMWHESDERSMSDQIEPEILKSSLLEETLILLSLGIQNPQHFSWLDKPSQSFSQVQDRLFNWQLIDNENKITALGRAVQSCPLDLEYGLLFIELTRAGFQKQAARLLAFLETADFSKPAPSFDLFDISLNELGRRIEAQLNRLQFQNSVSQIETDFRGTLIKVFLRCFPEKMAQKKVDNSGISSLGRGVQIANHLIDKDSDYFLLLNGRDISDTTTIIDFAISFSQKEFELFSQDEQRIKTDYSIDFENSTIYKQQIKLSGHFVLTSGTKSPLDLQKDKLAFKDIFSKNRLQFFENHSHTKAYFRKIRFLQKKKDILKYPADSFHFLDHLFDQTFEALAESISSLKEFMHFDLFQLFIFLTPEKIKQDLQKIPNEFSLPSGKTIPIDYEAELAPLISVRLQELLGVFRTPSILDQRLSLTIELLAPNYRPTQITGDLENFWKTSYLDVRKDLRARYPKHDWPENPMDWKPEMSKRTKK